MRRRGSGEQLGFADAVVSARANTAIEKQVDWAQVATLVDGVRQGKRGRPPYAPLAVVKALLLQTWYGLSDEALCDALGDRLSFRRFCGFSLEEDTPDSTTLCRFRSALGCHAAEAVFEEVNRQLDGRGLIKADVSQTGSAANRSRRGEVLDPDARWLKHKRSMLGYKAHVAADADTLLVRAAKLTPANRHDSTQAAHLV
jgi:IS5 family transposase